MALEFLVNPRGAPRARASCRYTAVAGALSFEGQTEDVGPHGCQLVAPRPVPRGSVIQLVIRREVLGQPLQAAGPGQPLQAAGPGQPLEAAGQVAWVSPHEPWRLGVAFAEAARPAAGRFFDALVAGQPGLASWRQVPDRISLDAMIWLGPPPKLVVDFTPDEVAVLGAIGTGCTVFELKSRLRAAWSRAERAFFSLLAGRHVTLSRGGAVPYANWAGLLRELQAEVAAAALSDAPEPTPPPSPARRPAQPAAPAGDASSGLDLDPGTLELDLAHAAPGAVRARPPEAEEAWRQALAALAAGHAVAATALLRDALALAPGDAEIARKLGEVAARRR